MCRKRIKKKQLTPKSLNFVIVGDIFHSKFKMLKLLVICPIKINTLKRFIGKL